MIRPELLSFSFKTYLEENNGTTFNDPTYNFYSQNVFRDGFEDFVTQQVGLYSERLLEEGKYFELISVTSQIVTTPIDIVYVFSLEFEDEDVYDEEDNE